VEVCEEELSYSIALYRHPQYTVTTRCAKWMAQKSKAVTALCYGAGSFITRAWQKVAACGTGSAGNNNIRTCFLPVAYRGEVWGVQTPPRNSEDIGGVLEHMSKKNRRLDFLL